MATTRPGYCSTEDVLARLYAEEDPATIPGGAIRDALLSDLIRVLSREFDQLTDRPPLAYMPTYDVRLFSGRGAQLIDLDENALITKLEINKSPGSFPQVWTDITAELTSGQTVARPLRFWPKDELFRMQTFYVDPYRNGNLRLTGVWGVCQPDLGAAIPSNASGVINDPNYPSFSGVSLATVQPLNASGTAQGWWIVPEDVANCVASWSVYVFKSAQGAFADSQGGMNAPAKSWAKDVPPFVSRVVQNYSETKLHLAVIGTDGNDFAESATYPGGGDPNTISRWANWQTSS